MKEYTVGSEVLHRIWGKGTVVGDYTDCGRPEYRQVMFKDRAMGGKVSVTLSLAEVATELAAIKRECYEALVNPAAQAMAEADKIKAEGVEFLRTVTEEEAHP